MSEAERHNEILYSVYKLFQEMTRKLAIKHRLSTSAHSVGLLQSVRNYLNFPDEKHPEAI